MWYPFYYSSNELLAYDPYSQKKLLVKTEEYLDLEDETLEKKTPPPQLRVMYLLVTEKCNFLCKYCFIEQPMSRDRKDMPKKTAENAFKMFLRLKGKKMIFYGGEPLLNKETVFFAGGLAKEKKKSTSMVTNGALVDQDTAQKIASLKINVGVSIDGRRKAHDSARVTADGKPSFDLVMKGWKNLKEYTSPGISFTIGKHNINTLEEEVEWACTQLETQSIGFNLPSEYSKGNPFSVSPKKAAEKLIKAYQICKQYGVYEDRVYNRRIKPFVEGKFWAKDCAGCGNEIAVLPDGSIGPCHGFASSKKYFMPTNFRENPLKNRTWREWNARYPANMAQCKNCAIIGVCGGGCPYYAETVNGSMWARDTRHCTFCGTILSWLIKKTIELAEENFPKLITRKIMPGDEEALKKFVETVSSEGFPKIESLLPADKFVAGMNNLDACKKGTCFITENRKGDMIGLANITPPDQNIGIFVLRECWGTQVAKNLLHACITECRKRKVDKITARTDQNNRRARRFLEKQGFKKTSGNKQKELTFQLNITQ